MKKRYRIICFSVALVFLTVFLFCIYLQKLNGETYYKTALNLTSEINVIPALRGKITDRNGELLVSNKLCMSVQVQSTVSEKDIEKLCRILSVKKTQSDSSGSYIIKHNVSSAEASKVKELKIQGVSVIKDNTRDYLPFPKLSHTLGYTGYISEEELEEHNGYEFNDVIGKCGIEQYSEDALKGADGYEIIRNGEKFKEKKAINGCDIKLTIDKYLQQAVESELEYAVKEVEKSTGFSSGGGVVAISVTTGEIYAIASYPDYSLSDIGEIYDDLLKNDSNPLLNRCISGVFEPGSTFKPIVALAALGEGVISETEKIEDLGVYKYYAPTYSPACHLWTSKNKTHGIIDVTEALSESCNYFFYETGRRLGIEKISMYAKSAGLGEKTGIELAGELSGTLASPGTKTEWYSGDTLQAAIGQSVNMFTPLQLATYTAFIANEGTLLKPYIVREIINEKGDVIEKSTKVIRKKSLIEKKYFKTVKKGMKKCVETGTASSAFSGVLFDLGGKTGTAQVPNGPENGIFIGFAPFESPEIAVSVVIEHGSGDYCSALSRRVFEKYFDLYQKN